MKFILTGANAGKTIKINHTQFTNGVAEHLGQVDKLGGLINYLASFNAYPAGSDALIAAQKRDKEIANGPSAIVSGQGRNPESGLQANESTSGPTGGTSATGTETTGQGSEAEGSGEESGRVAVGEQDTATLKVIDAVKSLSPDVDSNWTPEGLPSVAVVAEAAKVPTASRKMIETAMPGYNREKALAAVAAAI